MPGLWWDLGETGFAREPACRPLDSRAAAAVASGKEGQTAMLDDDARLERSAIRRISLRLVPFLMVCYFVAFVDRVNLGFAGHDLSRDLHLSSTVFGFGAGIFFLAYFIFEVPSNLLLERFGARRWIARIMVTWGLVAAAMALMTGRVVVLRLARAAGRGGGRASSPA